MPILYSDEQTQFHDEAAKLLAASRDSAALKRLLERRGAYDERFWASCREMGWTAITVPEQYDGLGMGLVDLALITAAAGGVTPGAPFLLTGAAVAAAILASGDEAAKAELLPKLAEGTIRTALATAEGPDILPVSCAVSVKGDRLTGTKNAIAGGAAAETALVLAAGEGGPVLCLVDLGADGVDVKTLDTIDNSRNLADLVFDGAPCRVLVGDGRAAALAGLARAIVAIASEQVGGADACLTVARDYANERVAFGQKIGRFQAVKHGIAEMYALNEIARSSALDAAMRLDGGDRDALLYAAAARITATKAYEYAARQATQFHGGIGVTWESDLHLHYRRSRALATEWGSQAYWEDVLVDMIGEAA